MRKILQLLKNVRYVNGLRRFHYASKNYFFNNYLQMIRWVFNSKEDTNYTYHLTEENLNYLAQTIACVTKSNFSSIINYFSEAQQNGELIQHIQTTIQHSDQKKFTDKEVRFGRRLGWYAFVRILKPKIVIETGVDKGLGSVLICSALLENKKEGFNGRYFGTDINPKAGFLLTGKYKEVGEILYGDSIDSLSGFKENIDIFINDSDHSSHYEYREYNTVKPLLGEKGIILGDNAHCTDQLSKFSLENDRHFLYFQEKPKNHWYPGGGIGISFK